MKRGQKQNIKTDKAYFSCSVGLQILRSYNYADLEGELDIFISPKQLNLLINEMDNTNKLQGTDYKSAPTG